MNNVEYTVCVKMIDSSVTCFIYNDFNEAENFTKVAKLSSSVVDVKIYVIDDYNS